ncbi:mycofactocin oligosaccharide methyltransferase MftM [uncultured Jatrophihabitans sp.]|uniref:mycofactocin oligosaccharide methyltransferase MftM n=1 Tax=uncultured Jatrophihabitans sp. TaxID=1610747 RepID=UPI0035CB1B8A
MSQVLHRPVAEPIEPLHSCPGGRYEDALVTVVHEPRGDGPPLRARAEGGRIVVSHRLAAGGSDDEVGVRLAEALAALTDDHEVFARAFTGVVLTTDRYAPRAWARFYRNTLDLIRDTAAPGYTGVYRHALDLLPTTSVADLGCSFGFLALHLASRGTAALAWDVDAGTTALLRCMARTLRRDVDVRDDVHAIADGETDGVALLHVLEHVDAPTGRRLLAHALRIARRRVVVAVPVEDVPDPLFGHVRRVGLDDLRDLGAESGWTYDVHDHLGGWLVLDRTEGSTSTHLSGCAV